MNWQKLIRFFAWLTMYVFLTIFAIGIAENMLNIDMSDPFWLAVIVIGTLPYSIVAFKIYVFIVRDLAWAITLKIVSMASPEILEILEKQKEQETGERR